MPFIEEYIEYLKERRTLKPRSYLKVSTSSDPKDVLYFYDGLSLNDEICIDKLSINS